MGKVSRIEGLLGYIWLEEGFGLKEKWIEGNGDESLRLGP